MGTGTASGLFREFTGIGMMGYIGKAVLAGVALCAAVPATAEVTTFATFTGGNGNIIFRNSGTGGSNTSFTSNGTGGRIYTTNSAPSVRPGLSVPGAVNVSFSFLLPALTRQVTETAALFTLNATTTSVAQSAFGFVAQNRLAGSFSFISKNAITVRGTTYAAGSNLLSATFGGTTILGANNATSGSLSGSTLSDATIDYTSDFVDFTNTVSRDFDVSLTAIVSLMNNVNRGLNFIGSSTARTTDDRALRSFRGTATGSFSADPAPLVNGVPEPAVWGMMIAGFGLIGVQSRRRRSVTTVTA